MRVLTILGTRPEIIRLSRIVPRLDRLCEHRLIHTGQNYEYELDQVFWEQLDLRTADENWGARGTLAEQCAVIFRETERVIREFKPERLVILGDTNSALSALIGKRAGICVCHLEAGNRCYDDRVPEEVNRRVVDQCSDLLMPYTERSRQNLIREGFPGDRVFVIGNPIGEVIDLHQQSISRSSIQRTLGLEPGEFFLVTLHRAENVDVASRLQSVVKGMKQLAQSHGLPVIVSTHPRTRQRLDEQGVHDSESDGVRFLAPLSFFDFVALEQHARCVLSDSGTVQEECAILGVPNVTLRDVTERPETVECGCSILSGVEPDSIQRCVQVAVESASLRSPPPEYLRTDVSQTVVKIILGFRERR